MSEDTTESGLKVVDAHDLPEDLERLRAGGLGERVGPQEHEARPLGGSLRRLHLLEEAAPAGGGFGHGDVGGRKPWRAQGQRIGAPVLLGRERARSAELLGDQRQHAHQQVASLGLALGDLLRSPADRVGYGLALRRAILRDHDIGVTHGRYLEAYAQVLSDP